LGKHSGQSAWLFGEPETDCYRLLEDVVVEKAQTGQCQAAAYRSPALFVFQLQQVVLDHFSGDGSWGLTVVIGQIGDRAQMSAAGVRGKVLSIHLLDRLLTQSCHGRPPWFGG
jgi:hypothetical protein